jgi:hypothetical protein
MLPCLSLAFETTRRCLSHETLPVLPYVELFPLILGKIEKTRKVLLKCTQKQQGKRDTVNSFVR